MKAYSVDLREKVVAAVDNKEGSLREIAKRFRVSKSFIDKLIKQRREIGTIAPLPHGGGSTPLVDVEKEVLVGNRVLENIDSTLQELCDYLEKRSKVRVSQSTMCRLLQKLDLRRKKNDKEL
jgi:transposase